MKAKNEKVDVGDSKNPKHPLERVLLQGRLNSFMRKNSAVFTALGTGTRGTVILRVPDGGSPPPA